MSSPLKKFSHFYKLFSLPNSILNNGKEENLIQDIFYKDRICEILDDDIFINM